MTPDLEGKYGTAQDSRNGGKDSARKIALAPFSAGERNELYDLIDLRLRGGLPPML